MLLQVYQNLVSYEFSVLGPQHCQTVNQIQALFNRTELLADFRTEVNVEKNLVRFSQILMQSLGMGLLERLWSSGNCVSKEPVDFLFKVHLYIQRLKMIKDFILESNDVNFSVSE